MPGSIRRAGTVLLATVSLAFGGVVLGGCSQSPSSAETVGKALPIRLAKIRGSEEGQIDEGEVRARFRSAFSTSKRFVLDESSGSTSAAMAFRALDASDDGGPAGLVLYFEIETPPAWKKKLGEEGLSANIFMEGGSGGEPVSSEILEKALVRASAVLEARLELMEGAPSRVGALLQSQDAELVLLALESIGRGQLREQADRVVELLSHPDSRVSTAAIETLGVVGEPRHVPALLENLRLADPSQAHRGYEALAQLGGTDARGFLEFVLRNEEDSEQRRAAERALREIDGMDDGRSTGEDGRARGHRG